MQFNTDHRVPRLKVTHPVAVLEKQAPTQMPVYVTNLTDVDIDYRKLTAAGVSESLHDNQPVPRAWDTSYALPVKIRDLLGGESGVLSGSFRPHPSPQRADGPGYEVDDYDGDSDVSIGRADRDFFAEVTPFQMHVKYGAYNTLVWVTSLAQGTPTAKAHVRIFKDKYNGLTADAAVLAEGLTDADGVAILPGRTEIEAKPGAGSRNDGKTFMVRVDLGKDLALMPLDGAFEIDTYRASRGKFWSGYSPERSHIRTWGMTAQGVYKLGDTIDYKLYVRNQNNRTLEPVPRLQGYKLQIIDPTGKTVQTESDVALSSFGAFAGKFRVPPSGAVGWYEFQLSGPKQVPGVWNPMRVLVADFTPAPFQVQSNLNGQLFEPGGPVEATTHALMHAGGPYANAAARVTARLWPQPLEITNPSAAGFDFASVEPPGQCGYVPGPDVTTVHESDGEVNDKGELLTRFQLPDADMLSARLEVESAVRDERGKFVANRANAEYRGRDRYVGLRTDRWTFEEGKPAEVQYLVVDKNGQLVSGVPVAVVVNAEVVSAARVKGAGDAYLTSYDVRWEERARCEAQSAAGAARCKFTPPSPGLYSIAATLKDTHGRPHTTELCRWVTGKGRVMWQEPADMSLGLIAEKESYKVGEHARYLVRNPFPGARALISVERFGVIKHWVQVLKGNTPVIDVKVEPDFMPGFYLSVVVTSPRVAPAPGTDGLDADGVDLGRPTYRIGYVKVPVEDPVKTLAVRIKTNRPSYKPRETVTVDLSAAALRPAEKSEPIEFAVAVLDEAVFDLIQDGKNYFDPYHGLYKLENLDLVNYGLLSRLIGLQKFEKKGANSGGDGGAGFDMRNITRYVAYWNPSVPADAHGHASLDFKLPDNLTGWRVFAIAVTLSDRVGLGDYKFKSSKLTELRPVMPNQLTTGDSFTAGFSVQNRADKKRTLSIDIDALGPVDNGSAHSTQTLTLEPFKRQTVWLPLHTQGIGTLKITAKAADRADQDGLLHTLVVNPRVSTDVAASYGTTLSDSVTESILFPQDMMPGIGELSVQMSPTVIGNVDGALRYVRDYPYLCWEQRLTKAILATNYLKLRDYLAPDLLWPEAKTLPQTMLDDAASFQAPNGGMAFWTPEDQRVSPYLSAATAVAFNQLRGAGFQVPEEVNRNLDKYLERMLRDNVAPSFYNEGMVSSVRAVALQALAERKRLTLSDLRRYEKYAPQMDLFGLAAYLNAATQVKGADDLAASLTRRILSHANQSGGQFHFSESLDDGYFQILATPMRSECAVLQALLRYGESPAGSELIGDLPFKLVRTITQTRGARDHWENTQENLYCTTALTQYSALYEKDAPKFTASASIDAAPLGTAQFAAFRDPPVTLKRDNGSADAGRKSRVRIERQGTGRLYYATRLRYSQRDAAAKETNAGIEVHREYSVQRGGRWQLLASPLEVKRGELLRVDLYVSVPAPRHFVVVDDPVPGGVEPVNRDLATASTVDADATEFAAAGGSFWFRFSDWSEYGVELWNFYHRELEHEAARFYSDYLPAGHYHLSYGAQAMAEGEFTAGPTRVEEMYDPDVYGKGLPAQLIVKHE
jgi:uncharacterized protein YfaS (alpha-2-macroglobulin family)